MEAKRKSKKAIVLLLTVFLCMTTISIIPSVTASVTVTPGYNPDVDLKAGVRYKSFDNGGDREVYLGVPDLGVGSNRVETDYVWTTNHYLQFDYRMRDGTDNLYTTVDGNDPLLTYPVGPLTDLDYIQIDVVSRNTGTVSFENVYLTYKTGGDALGTFTSNTEGSKSWMITGVDVTTGFSIEGTLVLTGSQPHGELSKVQISVGTLPDCCPEVWVDDDAISSWYDYCHVDSIQTAVDHVCPYGTIYVNEGFYLPTSTIVVDKPVTILGPYAGVDPRPFNGSIRTPGDVSEAIVDSNGVLDTIIYIASDDVTIDGLEIVDGTGDLVYSSSPPISNVVVKNCIIHQSSGDEGIQLKNCAYGSIHRNYIFDVAQDGANFGYSFFCDITENEITSSDSENAAIYVYDSAQILIQKNIVHGTTAANGIELYTNIGDIDIINNLVVDNEWMIKSRHHDYSGNAILGYKYTETGSTVNIFHNTLSNNKVSSASPYHADEIGFGNAIGINTVIDYSGLHYDGFLNIQNNIISHNGLPSYGYGIITKDYYGCPGPTPGNCVIQYNDFYNNGAGICSGTCCPVETVTNIFSDPMFIGLGSDYQLQIGSPCHDTGNTLGITDDVINTARDTMPDRGAYELVYSCIPMCRNVEDNIEFCSIQEAIDASTTDDGETIEVYPGNYTENAHNWVDIDIYKELTIIGQAGSSGTIIELHQRNDPSGAHMDGVSISASNVTLEGLTFTRMPGNPYATGFNIRAGINVHTPPPANTFQNIKFKDIVSEYSYSSNVVFDGGYTYENVIIEDCNFHHSNQERIFYQSPSVTINGLTIIDSHFDYAGYANPSVGDPVGFQLQGTTTDLAITGGTFNDNPNGGIGLRRVTNAVIEDVVVDHSGYASWDRSGIGVWEDMGTTSNVDLINPTIIDCGGRGLSFGSWSNSMRSISDITITGGLIQNSGNIGIMLYVGGSAAVVSDVTIDTVVVDGSNQQNMYFLQDSGGASIHDVIVENCEIINAVFHGVIYSGMDVAGSYLRCNHIVGNGGGAYNLGGIGVLDAECNWWGDCAGPSGEGPGSGDEVGPNVDYDPWTARVIADAGGPYIDGCDDNTINFMGSAIIADCCGLTPTVTYEWDFGDGNTETGPAPSHTYASAGVYTVSLTVTATTAEYGSCSDTDTVDVTINGYAIAEANGPYNAYQTEQFTVQFSSAGSDADPAPLSYHWDFGDGETSTEPNPTHMYTTWIDTTVTLTIENADGTCIDVDTASVTFYKENDCLPPIVHIENPLDGDRVSGSVNVEWLAIDEFWQDEDMQMYLYYSRVGSDDFHKIVGPIDNTGSYSWNTGGLSNGDYRLMVEGAGSCGLGHDSVMITVGGGTSGLAIDVMIEDTSIESTHFVKDGDNVEITATINGASGLTRDDVTADLTDFGRGIVVAESFDGHHAMWTLNTVDSLDEGTVSVTVYVDDVSGRDTIIVDNTKPELKLEKPLHGLYFFNGRFISLSRTIIIGPIDVKLDATDRYGIDKVVFSIDDMPVKTIDSAPYDWYMNEKLMGKHSFEVMVYDRAGNVQRLSQQIVIYNIFGSS